MRTLRPNAPLVLALVLVLAALGGCRQSGPPAPDAAAPPTTVAPVGSGDAGEGAADVASAAPDGVEAAVDAALAAGDAVAEPAPNDDDAPLALWPAVERGKLDNGLTYYVMKHGTPKGRASMWLAVNAGSLLEDEDQRGLAHFVEHMAFNGTKHFERSAIVDYLEKIGMRFGADLNAYTSYDETVYQLLVPTDDPKYLTTGLDILRDWAGEVAFDPAEVEKERGVVLEEWRLGRGPGERIMKKQHPALFAGSRYAEREPIGLPEVIKGASRDALVRFYRDWYRPDLMAVIVVGDLDPAWARQEIGKRFGDLQNPATPRPRTRAEVPQAGGTRVSIETDKELTGTGITVYDLVPHRPESTGNNLRRSIIEQVYQTALDARFEILARKVDAPFTRAGVGAEGLLREIDTFARSASVKQDRVEDALRSLFTEVARVERHGFSEAELARAKADIAEMYRDYEADEGTADGTEYTAEMTRNFFEGELMIGRKAEAAAVRRFLPAITLAELDAVAKSFGSGDNRVVTIAARDGVKLPTEARVRELIAEVDKADIGPWQDETNAKPLVATPPAPGKIVAEKTTESIGLTEWTLSNGAKVLVKPTDFEADRVAIVGSSPGGLATVARDALIGARNAEAALAVGGVGELDATALDQALAGKSASAATSIDATRESVSGAGSVGDLETVFQLMWLKLTAPRKDPAAVAVWLQGYRESLEHATENPAARFERELADVLSQGHPLGRALVAKDLDAIDLDKALSLHRDRFGDVSDFTFVFVGAVDLGKLRPLVETWLASLPGGGRAEVEKDPGVELPKGKVERVWHLGQEPKASVQLVFHGADTWSRDAERDMYILTEVLNLRLHQVLREDLAGTYGVRASGTLSRAPRQERILTIRFGCAPENVDKLVAAALEVGHTIAKEGPTADELAKVREEFVRTREDDLRQNGFWLGWLAQNARFGDDPARILDSSGILGRMNADAVKAAAARYLDPKGDLFRAILLPAAK